MKKSWDIHRDLRASRAAWPAAGSSLHPSSLLHQQPPLQPPPSARGSTGMQAALAQHSHCCLQRAVSWGPGPWAHFPKLLHLSASKQLLSSSLSFSPPSHSPARSPRACHPTHPGRSPTALPGAHTALGYHSLSLPPLRHPPPPWYPNITVSIQRSPQTRNGHQPGPFLLRGDEDCVLERGLSDPGELQEASGSLWERSHQGQGRGQQVCKKCRRAWCRGGRADPPALPWNCCRAAG